MDIGVGVLGADINVPSTGIGILGTDVDIRGTGVGAVTIGEGELPTPPASSK